MDHHARLLKYIFNARITSHRELGRRGDEKGKGEGGEMEEREDGGGEGGDGRREGGRGEEKYID